MLTNDHLKTSLKALATQASALGKRLQPDVELSPEASAEAFVEISRLNAKLAKLGPKLAARSNGEAAGPGLFDQEQSLTQKEKKA
jgi:hypothetical protein